MLTCFATRATFVADTKNVSENLQNHFSCPHGVQQCCRLFPWTGNIPGHSYGDTIRVSSFGRALRSNWPRDDCFPRNFPCALQNLVPRLFHLPVISRPRVTGFYVYSRSFLDSTGDVSDKHSQEPPRALHCLVPAHISARMAEPRSQALSSLGARIHNEALPGGPGSNSHDRREKAALSTGEETLNAGLHVRRKDKHKHKHKPRVDWDDASTSARKRNACLCLRRPSPHVACACACAHVCACVVRVNQP